MKLHVRGIPTEEHERLRAGGADAHGQAPLIERVNGGRSPCRHCLGLIAEGDDMMVLAYRPFAGPSQPYSETGPIFLHHDACPRYDSDALPTWFVGLDPAAIRGYGADDRIRYETGQIVRGAALAGACEEILSDPAVAYVHIRSKFGCFQCRVDRG